MPLRGTPRASRGRRDGSGGATKTAQVRVSPASPYRSTRTETQVSPTESDDHEIGSVDEQIGSVKPPGRSAFDTRKE